MVPKLICTSNEDFKRGKLRNDTVMERPSAEAVWPRIDASLGLATAEGAKKHSKKNWDSRPSKVIVPGIRSLNSRTGVRRVNFVSEMSSPAIDVRILPTGAGLPPIEAEIRFACPTTVPHPITESVMVAPPEQGASIGSNFGGGEVKFNKDSTDTKSCCTLSITVPPWPPGAKGGFTKIVRSSFALDAPVTSPARVLAFEPSPNVNEATHEDPTEQNEELTFEMYTVKIVLSVTETDFGSIVSSTGVVEG